eukprot:m.126173 g.126173  ORF g.126173 m.126173 type:complete len:133 (-) comp13820_c0_seq1:834-1232(-)
MAEFADSDSETEEVKTRGDFPWMKVKEGAQIRVGSSFQALIPPIEDATAPVDPYSVPASPPQFKPLHVAVAESKAPTEDDAASQLVKKQPHSDGSAKRSMGINDSASAFTSSSTEQPEPPVKKSEAQSLRDQ